MQILNYHSVKISQRNRFIVTRDILKAQIDYCIEKEIKIVCLSDLEEEQTWKKCNIMLTFDDGYLDNYTVLFQMLKVFNIPAVIFPVVGYIGKKNQWDQVGELHNERLLGWDEIEEMSNQNIIFGSHSMTHPDLCKLDDYRLEWELRESKRILEERLNKPIIAFAYSFGRYNERVKKFTRDAGYHYAMTLKGYGRNTLKTDRLELQRVAIYGDESKWVTKAKINGLYDLINKVILFKKVVSRGNLRLRHI